MTGIASIPDLAVLVGSGEIVATVVIGSCAAGVTRVCGAPVGFTVGIWVGLPPAGVWLGAV